MTESLTPGQRERLDALNGKIEIVSPSADAQKKKEYFAEIRQGLELSLMPWNDKALKDLVSFMEGSYADPTLTKLTREYEQAGAQRDFIQREQDALRERFAQEVLPRVDLLLEKITKAVQENFFDASEERYQNLAIDISTVGTNLQELERMLDTIPGDLLPNRPLPGVQQEGDRTYETVRDAREKIKIFLGRHEEMVMPSADAA